MKAKQYLLSQADVWLMRDKVSEYNPKLSDMLEDLRWDLKDSRKVAMVVVVDKVEDVIEAEEK